MTLFEVDEAANRIRAEVDPDATIIFGSAFDEKLDGVMRVSVVATGIDALSQSVPLPFAETDTPAVTPAMPAPKMKQVINFWGLAASSASAEDAGLQDQEPVTANEQADEPQITVPSLTAQLQPEAAADTASTEVKEPEAAETQTPAASANAQLDLEDVTSQASEAGPAETATAAPAPGKPHQSKPQPTPDMSSRNSPAAHQAMSRPG